MSYYIEKAMWYELLATTFLIKFDSLKAFLQFLDTATQITLPNFNYLKYSEPRNLETIFKILKQRACGDFSNVHS